jgi:hypothetical protein
MSYRMSTLVFGLIAILANDIVVDISSHLFQICLGLARTFGLLAAILEITAS